MRKQLMYIASVLIALSFSSCGHKLVGTWQVEKYEVITAEQSQVSLSNIGTMTFRSNGKGKKDLKFSVMGVEQVDDAEFEWSATDRVVNIKSNNQSSEFSKSWILVSNKRGYQKWEATNGAGEAQFIELKK